MFTPPPCTPFCIFWTHYCMVKPQCPNLKIFSWDWFFFFYNKSWHVLDLSGNDIICEVCCVVDDEVALVPGRVVPKIFLQKFLHVLELIVPEVKLSYDPLAMLPGVVVLGVPLENLGGEVEFLSVVLQPLNYHSTVVPVKNTRNSHGRM